MNESTGKVLIGLGSNLGDRKRKILNAWERLGKSDSVQTLLLSPIIVTKPVGGPSGQPDFLNAVGLLETSLDPFQLLDLLHLIEREEGRQRHEFWGARTIDLDILLYDSKIITTDRLTLPHPRMAWRLFVLIPAVEIAPEMRHPLFNLTLKELYDLAKMNHRLASIPPVSLVNSALI